MASGSFNVQGVGVVATSVLVADDHEVVRVGIRHFLSSDNHFRVVGEASSGSECLELAETCNPDVVIMDVEMPDMDGVHTTKHLALLKKHMRIVAHSCHTSVAHVRGMFNAGAMAYVCKDDGWRELLRAINAVMDGRVYISSGINDASVGSSGLKQECRSFPRNLTRRQIEVLRLVGRGMTTKRIAHKLSVSERTVERHRRDIRQRTGLKSMAELVRLALDVGLV